MVVVETRAWTGSGRLAKATLRSLCSRTLCDVARVVKVELADWRVSLYDGESGRGFLCEVVKRE